PPGCGHGSWFAVHDACFMNHAEWFLLHATTASEFDDQRRGRGRDVAFRSGKRALGATVRGRVCVCRRHCGRRSPFLVGVTPYQRI
ncbi:hypothetical protein N9L68_09350, partial [bacterium]|nr:hypothetical protein [bacterium]